MPKVFCGSTLWRQKTGYRPYHEKPDWKGWYLHTCRYNGDHELPHECPCGEVWYEADLAGQRRPEFGKREMRDMMKTLIPR